MSGTEPSGTTTLTQDSSLRRATRACRFRRTSTRDSPGTRTRAQVLPQGTLHDPDEDTGWLAQFYVRPNRLFFPDPTELALIGPLPLKLSVPKAVREANLPACLYPDPSDSFAMVMVMGLDGQADDPFAAAYDVAGPILDELSFRYDQPLPVAQSLVVGIPSGAISYDYAQHPSVEEISPGEVVLPSCPYLELRDAVALYREGVSSNNPFHAFLALWKAYENVTRDVRPAWRREHRRPDTKVRAETIPDVWAQETFYGSPRQDDTVKVPREFVERLTDALCYAA